MPTGDPWLLSVDDRTALAELVAHPFKPHPFGIDADNRNAGTLPGIAEAVGTDSAYAVNVAPDVVVIDLDDPEDLPQLDAFAAWLGAHGWPVLRVASGQEGHRHLWTVIPPEADRDSARLQAATLGLAPRTGAMRPPGTPHRSGLAVRALDDPEAFRAGAVAARTVVLDHDPARERLDWRELLRTGQWPKGWKGEGSSSAMVWHMCIGAIRAGYDLETVRGWLADENNKGGSGYRDRLNNGGKQHGDYWLTHYVWPSATDRAAETLVIPRDATEARRYLDAIREAIAGHRWQGIGGASDRAVLAALVDRAYARGSLTPTMSHREIAEAARCSRRTSMAAVKRLEAAGWLLVAKTGRGVTEQAEDHTYRERANATRWRLRLPDTAARTFPTGGTPLAGTQLSGASTRGDGFMDVCRWRGVGQNATRVLEALATSDLTTAELAADLGLNRGNLRYRLLPRLADLGLIVAKGDRWELPDDLDAALEAAAEALGLTGKAENVAAQHTAERAGYLEYREATRPKRLASARRRAAAARRGAPPPDQPTLWSVEGAPAPLEALDANAPPEPLQVPSPAPTGSGAGRAR